MRVVLSVVLLFTLNYIRRSVAGADDVVHNPVGEKDEDEELNESRSPSVLNPATYSVE